MDKTISRLAVVMCLTAANTAVAQVTPDQVWIGLVATYENYGFTVNATTEADGGALRIGDVTGDIVLPADIGRMTLDMPGMVLTDNGDGTVSVVQPDDFSGTLRGNLQIDGKMLDFSLDVTLSTRDAQMTVSGAPGALVYHNVVGRYDIMMDNLRATGLPDLEGVDVFVGLTIDDSDTTTHVDISDTLIRTEATSTAGRTVIEFNISPDFGMTTRSVTLLGKTESTITISVPVAPFDAMNIAAALRDGLSIAMNSTTFDQTAQTAVYLNDELISLQDQIVAESLQQFSLSQDGLIADYSASGIVFDFPMDDTLQIPVRFAADAGHVALKLPVSASAAPQDFGLGFALRGVTLSDDLWDLFDATGTLPRDPAILDLAIDGQASLSVDLFDFNALTAPAMMERMARGDMPARVTALTMPRLVVNGAGAALTGTGSFAIDNGDLVTFYGLPKPVGKATFEMAGANGLIDDLISLGLIGPDEAMGARMGMAMVGRATGDDAMTSVIEINAAGHVIVNGQRMQ